jgi:hypothetical protein
MVARMIEVRFLLPQKMNRLRWKIFSSYVLSSDQKIEGSSSKMNRFDIWTRGTKISQKLTEIALLLVTTLETLRFRKSILNQNLQSDYLLIDSKVFSTYNGISENQRHSLDSVEGVVINLDSKIDSQEIANRFGVTVLDSESLFLDSLSTENKNIKSTLIRRDFVSFRIIVYDPNNYMKEICGDIPTQNYFFMNENLMFCTVFNLIQRYIQGEVHLASHPKSRVDEKLYLSPSTIKLTDIIVYANNRILRKVISFKNKLFGKQLLWNIYFGIGNNFEDIANQSITYKKIDNPPNYFLADPFLFSHKEQGFCLAEAFDLRRKKGMISKLIYSDNTLKFDRIVLEEEFHLSFPYIFEYQNRMYMCPETSEISEVRLYLYDEQLKTWEFYSTLLTNISAVDSLIFEKNGYWWLMFSVDPIGLGNYTSELHLYYSTSPIGSNWSKHPQSPVSLSSTNGRNAGLVILDDQIYRVAQKQGFNTYGKQVCLMHIDSITPTDYSESVYRSELPYPNKLAMASHHLDIKDNYIVRDSVEYSK